MSDDNVVPMFDWVVYHPTKRTKVRASFKTRRLAQYWTQVHGGMVRHEPRDDDEGPDGAA